MYFVTEFPSGKSLSFSLFILFSCTLFQRSLSELPKNLTDINVWLHNLVYHLRLLCSRILVPTKTNEILCYIPDEPKVQSLRGAGSRLPLRRVHLWRMQGKSTTSSLLHYHHHYSRMRPRLNIDLPQESPLRPVLSRFSGFTRSSIHRFLS